MPHNDRSLRDRWPVLPSTTSKLAFDTPAREFLASDGWKECRFGYHDGRARRREARLVGLARTLFVVFAIVALGLCARLAAKLLVGSVGSVAPVATLAVPRLD